MNKALLAAVAAALGAALGVSCTDVEATEPTLSAPAGGAGGASALGGNGGAETLDSRVRHALVFAEQQLAGSVDAIGDPTRYPQSAPDGGSWMTTDATNWTSGFFPGCLWLVHEHTGRADFRDWAEQWTANLDNQKDDTGSHDVGFQILSSYGQGRRIADVAGYEEVMLTAAGSLDTRYSATVGCVRSWDWGTWTFPVIIDNMMNLELLLWAANNGGSSSLRTHAVSHAQKTAAEHIRADDTTYHVVDYDSASGDVIWKGHWQGLADESTWSRGMAWGIYGFTMVHRETSDPAMLAAAERLASWFIDHLPADRVPYWDFDAADLPDAPRDTSAAAVAASAFLELAEFTPDDAHKSKYRNAAHDILYSLTSTAYLADGTGSSAILRHGYYQGPKSVIFGDYYFLEAMLRYLRGIP